MKLVIQNASHVFGGNEKWLATLATGLMERGHDVIVSCPRGPVTKELTSRGIAVSPFRPRGAVDFVSGAAFTAWLAGERPDTVLLTSWRTTAWSVLAARTAGVKRVVVRLGIVRSRPTAGPRALALDSVDALIVNSAEIQKTWYATKKQGPSVHVVLNGVRTRMSEREALRRRLRDEVGVGDSTIVVGGAGHIAARKGFDILIRAFHHADVGDSHLVIIGDGADRPRLEALASELGLTKRTHFLGHREDGAAAITGLDLFVLSSHNEGMANVMLEAMAGGTPVIAADISGVRKAIGATDERAAAGWTVPAANPEMFAGAIATAASAIREDPRAVEAIAEEAAWRATNWFGTARMISECEAILFPGFK